MSTVRPSTFQSSSTFTKARTRIGISRAFSYQHNPRNLEHEWYPPWNTACTGIIGTAKKDTAVLSVAPQYIIYYDNGTEQELDSDSEGELEDTDVEDEAMDGDDDSDEAMNVDNGDGAGDDADDEEEHVDADEEDEEDEEGVDELSRTTALSDEADTQSDSDDDSGDAAIEDHLLCGDDDGWDSDGSQRTIPATSNSKTQITDFAIICTTSEKVSATETHPDGHRAWARITSERIPFIVEIKRFPSRQISLDNIHLKIALYISRARMQVVQQALLLFIVNPQDTVIVIAASGPWYSHTILRRSQFRADFFEMIQRDPSSITAANVDIYTRVAIRWSLAVKLESAASNARMKEFGRHIYRSMSG